MCQSCFTLSRRRGITEKISLLKEKPTSLLVRLQKQLLWQQMQVTFHLTEKQECAFISRLTISKIQQTCLQIRAQYFCHIVPISATTLGPPSWWRIRLSFKALLKTFFTFGRSPWSCKGGAFLTVPDERREQEVNSSNAFYVPKTIFQPFCVTVKEYSFKTRCSWLSIMFRLLGKSPSIKL